MDTASRQRRLVKHYLFDAEPSDRLRGTVDLAAETLDFPIAMINVVDDRLQHTIASHGMGGMSTYPRQETFCQHVVDSQEIIAASDTRADPRFADLPVVRAGEMLSYVGVPLSSRESATVGTLCVLDTRTRDITAEHLEHITYFAGVVEDQLELLRRNAETGVPNASAAGELVHAIGENAIVPWYQPIVDLDTGRVHAYEALARWIRPTGEIVDPGWFVPLAEDSDLVLDLDLAVMRGALRDLRRWEPRQPGLRMNVNLSTRHLEVEGGVDDIARVADEEGVPPDSVTLELTESHQLQDQNRAAVAVDGLRRHGFAVVLDDFGSGWSSLDWILQLPIAGIKVDRAVTVQLGNRVGDAVTRAVAGMAAELGLTLTLEGIANDAHALTGRRLGYDFGQGYYWSPPRPAAAIDAAAAA